MLTDEECVNLKYDTFNKKLSKGIGDLYEDEGLTDVSILCEGRIIKAHKLILCLASEKLKNILQIVSGQYPVIVFNDLKYLDVLNILQFIYKGEVQLEKKKLDDFLKTAYCLGIGPLIETYNLLKSSENNHDLEKTNTNLNDTKKISENINLYNVKESINVNESTNESAACDESCNIDFTNIDNVITNIKKENDQDSYQEIENECSNHGDSYDNNQESFSLIENDTIISCYEPSTSTLVIENSESNNQDIKKYDVRKKLFLQKFFILKQHKKDTQFSIITRRDYQKLLNEVSEAKTIKKKSALHYRRLKRFDIIENNGVLRLIIKNNSNRYFLPIDEIFDVLEAEHILTKHGGREKLRIQLKRKYVNVTKEMISYFLSLCKVCQIRKSKNAALSNLIQYNVQSTSNE